MVCPVTPGNVQLERITTDPAPMRVPDSDSLRVTELGTIHVLQ